VRHEASIEGAAWKTEAERTRFSESCFRHFRALDDTERKALEHVAYLMPRERERERKRNRETMQRIVVVEIQYRAFCRARARARDVALSISSSTGTTHNPLSLAHFAPSRRRAFSSFTLRDDRRSEKNAARPSLNRLLNSILQFFD